MVRPKSSHACVGEASEELLEVFFAVVTCYSSILGKEHFSEENLTDFDFSSESSRIEKFVVRACAEEDA